VIDGAGAGAEPGLVANAGPPPSGFVIGGALPAASPTTGWCRRGWTKTRLPLPITRRGPPSRTYLGWTLELLGLT